MNDLTCRAIKGLDDKEKFIFENRILGSMTLSDVGDVLGVTGERIRRIEIKVKTKLRNQCFKGMIKNKPDALHTV